MLELKKKKQTSKCKKNNKSFPQNQTSTKRPRIMRWEPESTIFCSIISPYRNCTRFQRTN